VHGEVSPRPHGGALACRRAGERVGKLGAVGAGERVGELGRDCTEELRSAAAAQVSARGSAGTASPRARGRVGEL